MFDLPWQAPYDHVCLFRKGEIWLGGKLWEASRLALDAGIPPHAQALRCIPVLANRRVDSLLTAILLRVPLSIRLNRLRCKTPSPAAPVAASKGTSVCKRVVSTNPTHASSTSSRSAPPKPFVSWPLRENEHGNAFTRPDPSGRLPVRRTPKRFRDLDHVEIVFALHDAMPTFGTVYAFTANLGDDFEVVARAASSAASFVLDAIDRHVRRELGRSVRLWFCLEEADGREHRLHLHGEAAIEEHEKERFRYALRQALGEWQEVRQFQTHTAQAPGPDDGWPGYASKRAVWLLKGGVVEQIKGRRINGAHYAASEDVRREAQRLYNEKRAAALQALKAHRTNVAKQSSINTDLSEERNTQHFNNTIDDTLFKTHEERATTWHKSRESAHRSRITTKFPSSPQKIRTSARRTRARSNHVAAAPRTYRPGRPENRARRDWRRLAGEHPTMTNPDVTRMWAAWSKLYEVSASRDRVFVLRDLLDRLGPDLNDPDSRIAAAFPHDLLLKLRVDWFANARHEGRAAWVECVRALQAAGISFATPEEQAQLDALPGRVELFRGVRCLREKALACAQAPCWSPRLDQARSYAMLASPPRAPMNGYVLRAEAPRDALYAALFTGEVIVAHLDRLENVEVIEVHGSEPAAIAA